MELRVKSNRLFSARMQIKSFDRFSKKLLRFIKMPLLVIIVAFKYLVERSQLRLIV